MFLRSQQSATVSNTHSNAYKLLITIRRNIMGLFNFFQAAAPLTAEEKEIEETWCWEPERKPDT
ncbi:MAG: hypothetical protein HC908_18000 [Calothrix sp. SM1_7_51]|nr:hypothetical protein [Calothrix sp. SM1_7_51]